MSVFGRGHFRLSAWSKDVKTADQYFEIEVPVYVLLFCATVSISSTVKVALSRAVRVEY